ncbi:MAG: thiol-disulfide oxidoreductase ResA family protein [Bacilli bacterium]|nr:thiol-disulfide oxidoreductase ResA family protein [Bacilli bacterium]
MNKNITVFIVLMLLVGVAIFQNLNAHGKEKNEVNNTLEVAPKAHFQAPAFDLEGMDGQTYKVGGKRDKPVLVNFWASWCDACEIEAPDLKQLYDKYKGQFDLYAVNTTDKDHLADAQAFVKSHSLPFPILLDTKGKAADLYRFSFIPTSFLIDRNGVVVEVVNLLTAKELESKIKKLIKG